MTVENQAGLNQSCQEILIELSSINDLSNQLNIDIFPNPTNGRFTLNWTGDAPKDALVRIVTINGQVIAENDLFTSGSQNFQLDHHPASVYMVQILSAEGALVKRIFKE